MPYTTVYLQYSEARNEDAEQADQDDEDHELEGDGYEYSSDEDRVLVEFNPIKLSSREPRGESVELELDFEAEVGETLHLVVVRYNDHRNGLLEDWCVEKVLRSGDEAEELVEQLEDGLSGSECADSKQDESVVVKAEVFSMVLHR